MNRSNAVNFDVILGLMCWW